MHDQPALMPFKSALRCMNFPRAERQQVLLSCLELLKPGGWLVVVDLHPAGPLLQLPQQLFCALFETETAIALLEDNIPEQLQQIGFTTVEQICFGRALLCSASQQSAPIAACWRQLGSCHELGSNISRKANTCDPASLDQSAESLAWAAIWPQRKTRCLPKAHGTAPRRAAPTGVRTQVLKRDWSWSSPATARAKTTASLGLALRTLGHGHQRGR